VHKFDIIHLNKQPAVFGNLLIQPTYCKREFEFGCLWQARFDGTPESADRTPTCLGAGVNYGFAAHAGFIMPCSGW